MNNHVPLEHCLAAANKTQYLDVLLSNGGNPNAVGKESRTALDIATFYGLANVVEMLLASGADPNC
jgi:ankyrin repeat protein